MHDGEHVANVRGALDEVQEGASSHLLVGVRHSHPDSHLDGEERGENRLDDEPDAEFVEWTYLLLVNRFDDGLKYEYEDRSQDEHHHDSRYDLRGAAAGRLLHDEVHL